MPDQIVRIVDHDPNWSDRFAAEQEHVRSLLGPLLATEVEHVGSTAVPGLRAKPIIDMLAEVHSLEDARAALPTLEKSGWWYWAEDPMGEERLWLLRPSPEQRTHHLQIRATGSPQAQALLAFRDALRGSQALRIEYAALKEWLAKRHPSNRNAYTNAKSAFVDRVLRESGITPPQRVRLPE
ncbi:GrpB family protein [Lipingzhangella sp. LS1_29]|uniref:GrpB family protein n=1 Tax=Lipingzhangella rawalii TaxID=2055835 RepID=A0ABU2H174_9ACTN|nr:GrpB family protein [Lipingzhangella rawalii]MDS1268742.1 GrpB family protein [Lipingzhangella rawalii]